MLHNVCLAEHTIIEYADFQGYFLSNDVLYVVR